MTTDPYKPNTLGEINITTGVLEAIAAKAASEVPGVSKLHTSLQREVGGFFGMDSSRIGATIKRTGGSMTVDVSLHLTYGYSVPEVALNVQQKVKEQILFMTDLNVQEVNVHVISVETEPYKEVEYLHLEEESDVNDDE